MDRATVHRHEDLTFRHNVGSWRHGWLRLTPAYSMKLVDEIIARSDAERILDPFSGTGTTPTCAADLGRIGRGVDINPFLVWLGNTKTAHYTDDALTKAQSVLTWAINRTFERDAPAASVPPIHKIERWWSPNSIRFLCRLKGAIEQGSKEHSPERDLLLIIFCRTLIRLSNAAFNHQSMSFKDTDLSLLPDFEKHELFELTQNIGAEVLDSAAQNPSGSGEVVFGDARDLTSIFEEPFDLLVTSPPYANRMSYIRELRPYMYWLGYLSESREAGELDWQAIGGTWGVATSRVATWPLPAHFEVPKNLAGVLESIEAAHPKNGRTLSNYVAKYFYDIQQHVYSISSVMRPTGEIHYVVGNSTFYGNLVSTEQIYAEFMKHAGFSDVSVQTLRKRNSNKQLFEFMVSGRAAKKKRKKSASRPAVQAEGTYEATRPMP